MPHQSTKPIVTCAHCGKQFVGQSKRTSRFCSLTCYAGRKVTVTCRECGAEYRVKRSKTATSKYCSRACKDLAQSGDTAGRFWSWVDTSAGPDGCWLWIGSVTRGGYGRFSDGGTAVSAHRWSYVAAYGPLLPGLLVQHACDTPPCVNPAHLYPGTPATNTADSVMKGRNARGERCHLAKLTDEQVRTIRRRYAAGGITQRELAAAFAVGAKLIGRVVRGEHYRHLL